MTTPTHGTVAGYGHHRRHNEPACEPCLTAFKTYQREYRNKPKPRESLQRRWKARTRAYAELVRQHPDEYARIYQQKLTELTNPET